MVENDAGALFPHDRQRVLHRHHAAAQIDGADAVEGFLGDLENRRVAAAEAHADIVVQDIDASPAIARRRDHRLQRLLLGDVGLARHALAGAAALLHHRDGLFRRREVVVDRQHLGAFLREAQHGRAAVAHAGAGRLAGADDDRDLVLETHEETLLQCCRAGGSLRKLDDQNEPRPWAFAGPG